MTDQPDEAATLIDGITTALNRLEALDIDVQMPATLGGAGVRTDAGTLTFERYEDGAKLAAITWTGDKWQTSVPAAAEGADHA